MAPPPTAGTLTRESMPEAPGWVEKLLKVLNPFFAQVRTALAKGLTVRENLDAEWLTVTLTAPTLPDALPVSLRRTAHAVLLGRVQTLEGSAPTAAPAILWETTTRTAAGGAPPPRRHGGW
jgi:hypothetical protein